MSLFTWLRKVVSGISTKNAGKPGPGRARSRWSRYQLWLEHLETRLAPASNMVITNGGTSDGTFVAGLFTPTGGLDTVNISNTDIQAQLNAGTSIIINTNLGTGPTPPAGNITFAAGATIQKT